MPLQDIERKFRKSEMTLIAWRSQEQAAEMEKQFQRPAASSPYTLPVAPPRSLARAGDTPMPIPEECYNEEGEPDIRKMTGNQALSYMRAAGFNLPVIPGRNR